jgi:hypothetical protein
MSLMSGSFATAENCSQRIRVSPRMSERLITTACVKFGLVDCIAELEDCAMATTEIENFAV